MTPTSGGPSAALANATLTMKKMTMNRVSKGYDNDATLSGHRG
nr:K198 [uncultured bacterium]